jgi:FixJ family two-component response regulator
MTNKKPVVYVVDDDPSVLQSVDRLLRAASYDVRTFTSALAFLDFCHLDAPGCLVLDVRMPELSGLELQERLADKEISFPVIFITGHGTVPMSVQAMKAGAVDFLQKPFDTTNFLDAIAKAIAKDRQAKQDQEERKQLRVRLEALTPREYEVFGLVVTGMPNKQIAFDLGTTEKTIKVHRARVFEKIGVASLADLVRFAERLGIRSTPI